jgi:hypothetical protein
MAVRLRAGRALPSGRFLVSFLLEADTAAERIRQTEKFNDNRNRTRDKSKANYKGTYLTVFWDVMASIYSYAVHLMTLSVP